MSSSDKMKYRFYTCDVFTESRFGGNQLAVLPDAQGLTDEQMQQIAREFNYSESTFVFPPDGDNTRKVRIFTPAQEIPFAGHPNVGTAFVLASLGEIDLGTVTFEEKAGLVSVFIAREGNRIRCELKAPQPLSLGMRVPANLVAEAASLAVEDIVVTRHPPQVASVGFPFVFAELKDQDALARTKVSGQGFDALAAFLGSPYKALVYVYIRSEGDFDIRSRMFAPLSGVPEDPATGSAACAVAGLQASLESSPSGSFAYRIAQGIEMGRPSLLNARTEKTNDAVHSTWVSGTCVMVAEGTIEV